MGSKNSNEYSGIKIKLYNFALSDQGRPKTLPPLRTLAKEYGCTHPTVLRAVRDLIVQGVIVPLKGGGYRTLQLDSAGEHHIVNYMFGNGMNLYVDHYTLQLRYHSLNTLTRQHVQLGVAEFRQSSAGDFAHEMTYGNCDAGLLVDPPAQIVEEIAGVCAGRNIPLGVFGSSFPGGDISCSFDVEKGFLNLSAAVCWSCAVSIITGSPAFRRLLINISISLNGRNSKFLPIRNLSIIRLKIQRTAMPDSIRLFLSCFWRNFTEN